MPKRERTERSVVTESPEKLQRENRFKSTSQPANWEARVGNIATGSQKVLEYVGSIMLWGQANADPETGELFLGAFKGQTGEVCADSNRRRAPVT